MTDEALLAEIRRGVEQLDRYERDIAEALTAGDDGLVQEVIERALAYSGGPDG